MDFQDQELKCIEENCGESFLWTASEQKYYEDKKYDAPKRCKNCRPIARARFNERHGKKETYGDKVPEEHGGQ